MQRLLSVVVDLLMLFIPPLVVWAGTNHVSGGQGISELPWLPVVLLTLATAHGRPPPRAAVRAGEDRVGPVAHRRIVRYEELAEEPDHGHPHLLGSFLFS